MKVHAADQPLSRAKYESVSRGFLSLSLYVCVCVCVCVCRDIFRYLYIGTVSMYR
jgi:hypothetical protein